MPTSLRPVRRAALAAGLALGLSAALAATGAAPSFAAQKSPKPPVVKKTKGPAELVPLYDNADPAKWQTACSQTTSSRNESLLIADPFQGAGPGTGPVPAWTSVITKCPTYGNASVIGYVWTNYGQGGAASLPAIEAQVKNWYSFYPHRIAGIFFDGVSDTIPGTTTSNVSFYQTLASYVRKVGGSDAYVVQNFGANPASGWMFEGNGSKNADIVVTFEGSYDNPSEGPFTQWTQAAWEKKYPAANFAALIYDTNDSAAVPQPSTACSALLADNIGYVYVGTWYDQIAPYFPAFVQDC